MGVGGGLYGIVALCVATVTTFAVPVFVVLWLTHSPPFSQHVQRSSAELGLCSQIRNIASYDAKHGQPTTQLQLENSLTYDELTLTAAKSLPPDIQSTVSSTAGTIHSFLSLIRTIDYNGTATNAERLQATNLDNEYVQEGKTLDNWAKANC